MRQGLAEITRYLTAHQLPAERTLLRLDGQYGTGAVLADLAGFAFVTRGKEYTVLDHPSVSARLHLPPDQVQQRPESQMVRSLYDCPDVPVGSEGLSCRVVVATHPAGNKKSPVGVTRKGIVYELFFSNLPQQAFTASDVVELYLHRGAFEPALADKDAELDPDRWCSHSAWGPYKYRFLGDEGGKRRGKRSRSATMRKTLSNYRKQENDYGLPRPIIAMDPGSVKGLCPLKPTPSLGTGTLERGHRVVWMCRDCPNQCSTRHGVGPTGTKCLSTLTRVVSGCGDQRGETGKKRREVEVSLCFAPLLRWILQLWKSEKKQLALVMDATTLGERWTILAISVVLSGCAIPVAWKVLPGKGEGSWRPHWEGLLKHLEGAVPDEWQVLVLADRGLYARWMWDAIRACGWHPVLRLNLGIKARAVGEASFEWVSRWVPAPGTSWKGRVECEASQTESGQGHAVAALGSRLCVPMDRADRSRARGGPDQLVWVAHLD